MLGFVSMSLFREGYGKDTRRGLRRGWKRTHQIKLRLAAGDAASSSGGASASLLVPSNKWTDTLAISIFRQRGEKQRSPISR